MYIGFIQCLKSEVILNIGDNALAECTAIGRNTQVQLHVCPPGCQDYTMHTIHLGCSRIGNILVNRMENNMLIIYILNASLSESHTMIVCSATIISFSGVSKIAGNTTTLVVVQGGEHNVIGQCVRYRTILYL